MKRLSRLRRWFCLLLPAALLLTSSVWVSAQAQQDANAFGTAQASNAALSSTLAVQRAFVAQIKTLGLSCALAPPRIVVTDVPSFGSYDPDTNTLRTSDWSLLNPEERASAYHFAPPSADEATARATFNEIAHHWIFVHEMGHWWQACRKANDGRQPYAFEYEADRIAAAYWNGVDPTLVTKMVNLAQTVMNRMPNPVPPGQEAESYFNANYESLGPTPAYRWFQARMIVSCGNETPKPTFAQALAIP